MLFCLAQSADYTHDTFKSLSPLPLIKKILQIWIMVFLCLGSSSQGHIGKFMINISPRSKKNPPPDYIVFHSIPTMKNRIYSCTVLRQDPIEERNIAIFPAIIKINLITIIYGNLSVLLIIHSP